MHKGRPEAEGIEIFSGLLLASTLERSLEEFDTNLLAQFAQQAFAHLLRKPHKRHSINVRPTGLVVPWARRSGPLQVLEILNDDMPFAVESVMAELHSRGLVPHLVFHPIFKVKRYGSGRLQ